MFWSLSTQTHLQRAPLGAYLSLEPCAVSIRQMPVASRPHTSQRSRSLPRPLPENRWRNTLDAWCLLAEYCFFLLLSPPSPRGSSVSLSLLWSHFKNHSGNFISGTQNQRFLLFLLPFLWPGLTMCLNEVRARKEVGKPRDKIVVEVWKLQL